MSAARLQPQLAPRNNPLLLSLYCIVTLQLQKEKGPCVVPPLSRNFASWL